MKADVVVKQGSGKVAWLVKWGQRSVRLWPPGLESKEDTSHFGILSDGGSELGPNDNVIEATYPRVTERPLVKHWKGEVVAIYRPLTLTEEQKDQIIAYARSRIGTRYGVGYIALHFIDSKLFFGKRVARRLHRHFNTEVCSELVDEAYLSAKAQVSRTSGPEMVVASFASAGKDFGRGHAPCSSAQPDDLLRFLRERTDLYACVRPFARIE